ncbi:MAG: hypothetical protein JWM87_4241 [Candidatus Eremiobacteraeota bacterium]|nr:hypothetical protein [Candidatus Eremiobacteraeota bacterium]
MKAKVLMPTAVEIAEARRRGEEAARVEPRAEHVAYDSRKKRLVLHLRRGAIVAIPVERIKWLRDATARQLAAVYADQFGDAIISDELDMHISVKGLLRDLVGLTGAASMLGSEGGKAKSPAKTTAARANGKRGGRPRKKAAA